MRAHQPGSTPIDIPETVPNPAYTPAPAPERAPTKVPEKVPEKVISGIAEVTATSPQRTSRSGLLPILPEHRAGGFYLKLPTNLIMFRWLEGIGMLREIMPRGRDMEAVFVDTIVNRPCNLGH